MSRLCLLLDNLISLNYFILEIEISQEDNQITIQTTHLEFVDYEGRQIILTNYYYNHIIEEKGVKFTHFHDNWVDTLKFPDYIGTSKSFSDVRIYIQENNKKRKYWQKYLIVVVNGNNLITSARFGKNLNFVKNLTKIDYEKTKI